MPKAILTPAQQEAARQGRRERQAQKAAQAAATVEALLADAGGPLPAYALSHAAKARKGNTRSLIALKCLDSPHIARSRQGRSDVQILPSQRIRANLWLQGPFGHTSAEREGARDSTLPPRRAGYFSPDGAFRGLFVVPNRRLSMHAGWWQFWWRGACQYKRADVEVGPVMTATAGLVAQLLARAGSGVVRILEPVDFRLFPKPFGLLSPGHMLTE